MEKRGHKIQREQEVHGKIWIGEREGGIYVVIL